MLRFLSAKDEGFDRRDLHTTSGCRLSRPLRLINLRHVSHPRSPLNQGVALHHGTLR